MHLAHDDECNGFQVDQDTNSGALFVSNLTLYSGEREVPLSSAYNSKRPYPLMFGECQEFVFDDNGEFSREFTEYLWIVSSGLAE